jgi:predicted transcriptional regulator
MCIAYYIYTSKPLKQLAKTVQILLTNCLAQLKVYKEEFSTTQDKTDLTNAINQ